MSANLREKIPQVVNQLENAYPEARLELDFSTPFELVIATILAAQCTDERVNRVTKSLFKKYRAPQDYLQVEREELEADIRSTGFYRNKAKSIVGCCETLLDDFDGKLPKTTEEMIKLPGVGRKTANIVLANAMGIPAIGIDTHATRVPNRLGWIESKKPDEIEAFLCSLLPSERWQRANILIQWHGRYTCKARNPECHRCAITDDCEWPEKEDYL